MHPRTHSVNVEFGGPNPKGTNIFFSDFSDDPWAEATVDDEGTCANPMLADVRTRSHCIQNRERAVVVAHTGNASCSLL